MAQAMQCDAGDLLPGAYLITDLETGDTFVACAGHFLDWCASAVRAAEEAVSEADDSGTPIAVDLDAMGAQGPAQVQDEATPADGATAAESNQAAADEANDALRQQRHAEALDLAYQSGDPATIRAAEAAQDGDSAPWLDTVLDASDEAAHRARTRRDLAARPDSAQTSETVTGPIGAAATQSADTPATDG